MSADGSRPVNLQVNMAATLPALPWIVTGLLVGGIIFLVGGVLPAVSAASALSGPGLRAH